MTNETHIDDPQASFRPAADPTLVQNLDRMLDELGEMARSVPPRAEFYSLALSRLQLATDSQATAIWLQGPEGNLVPAFNCQLESIYAQAPASVVQRDRQQLQESRASDRSIHVIHSALGNPIAVYPVSIFPDVDAFLTIYRPIDESPAVATGLTPLVSAVIELIVDYERGLALKTLQPRFEAQQQLNRLILQLNQSTSSTQLAYTLANDGRQYLGCDRMSVFKLGGGARHVATSGVARVDRRSRYSRRLGQLVQRVGASGNMLTLPSNRDELPRRQRALVDEFVADQGIEYLIVLPLKTKRAGWRRAAVTGAVTAEYFQPIDVAAQWRQLQALEPHVQVAWGNRIQIERNPLSGIGSFLATGASLFALDRIPRTIAILFLLAAAIGALIALDRDFDIEISGELVPVARPHVWAPVDGIVRQILVRHGDAVKRGELLAELESPELDLQLQKVDGQLKSAVLRREGYNISLRQAELSRDENPIDQVQLAAEIAEIDADIQNLEEEQRFLQRQREKLRVTSPIDGQVITWNVAELLADRPVRRGESLMVIGATTGPWQIEFSVPDRTMPYLATAQDDLNRSNLGIEGMIAGDPDTIIDTEISSISQVATNELDDRPMIRVIALLPAGQIAEPTVGMSVTGRVHCGRRSWLYVLTYEMVDAVRRKFFW